MKKNLLLILTIFIPILSFGQTKSFDSSKYSLGFKLGYFYPTKTSFQNFYSQSLADFPLSSIAVELDYQYKNDLHLFAEIKIIHNKMERYRDRRLFIIPTFIGFKYNYENSEYSNFFTGLGTGFYWVQMIFGSVLEVDENGIIIKEHEVFNKSFYGLGIKPFIGFDFKMSENSRIGIQFDYDISHIGTADKGGLGNTGGLLSNIFFNFDL